MKIGVFYSGKYTIILSFFATRVIYNETPGNNAGSSF